MKKLFSRIGSLLAQVQIRRFLIVVFIGFLVLQTTNLAFGSVRQDLTEKVRARVEQNDAQRPKTTGEWNQQARETEGNPKERLNRIGQQSAEALKEFGSGYVEGAKETAGNIKRGAAGVGKDISR
jgi:hypothetical protein